MPIRGRASFARASVWDDRTGHRMLTALALRGRCAERLDLAAAVGLAVRAHAVRLLRAAALRAGVHARRLEPVRGAPLVPARLGGFFLRDGHRRASIATGRFCPIFTDPWRA